MYAFNALKILHNIIVEPQKRQFQNPFISNSIKTKTYTHHHHTYTREISMHRLKIRDVKMFTARENIKTDLIT